VWDEVISEVDTNNDGQIDFEEFQLMMSKLANKRDTLKSHRENIAQAAQAERV